MSSTAGGTLRRHRLSVTDYRRMAEAGILRPDARVELIEGEIIDMAPIGSRHAGVVEQLASILRAAAGDSAMVRTQQPVSLSDRSEPEPDLAVVRARSDFYKLAHPSPADVFLLIEVAEASLQYDTAIKMPLYAQHAIPEVWVVDLEGERTVRYREPRQGRYRHVDRPSVNASLVLRAGGRASIEISSIFGARERRQR